MSSTGPASPDPADGGQEGSSPEDVRQETAGQEQRGNAEERDDLNDLRESRADRIARIKAQIEAGTYETEELLSAAINRLLRSGDDDGKKES